MYKLFIILVAFTVFASTGCDKETQFEIDRQLIRDHLSENNIEAQATQSGLFFRILEEGGNVRPNLNNDVEVRYTGTFLNGEEFDATEGNATAVLPLSRVIDGWQLGIPLVGRGGKIELWIPSNLGYGPGGRSPSIPPNSVLFFEVELVDFE